MAKKVYDKIYIEDATIINAFPFKNFSGEATAKTPAGNRSFCVYIPDDMVDKLTDDGWNVKCDRTRDGDIRGYYLPVAISFKIPKYAPEIYKVNDDTLVRLTEDLVSDLDRLNIVSMDIVVRPHNYDGGVKAYLEQMYVTIERNRFERKHANKRVVGTDVGESAEIKAGMSDDDCPF